MSRKQYVSNKVIFLYLISGCWLCEVFQVRFLQFCHRHSDIPLFSAISTLGVVHARVYKSPQIGSRVAREYSR